MVPKRESAEFHKLACLRIPSVDARLEYKKLAVKPNQPGSWEFFIPLYRDLPGNEQERSPSEQIASGVDIRLELFNQCNSDGLLSCPGCLRSFERQYLDLMDVDHIVPRSRGGTHTWDNVQLLCRTCNSSKQDAPLEVFLQRKTIKEWEQAIRAAGEDRPNDQLDGHWAYSMECTFFLNAIDTDYDWGPAFSLLNLLTLTLDALQGIIWKRRSQVTCVTQKKQFTDDITQQGVRIAIGRIRSCFDHGCSVCAISSQP